MPLVYYTTRKRKQICSNLNYYYYSVLLTQYCAGDKIEKNEMGGACGTYGGRERCAQGFGGET